MPETVIPVRLSAAESNVILTALQAYREDMLRLAGCSADGIGDGTPFAESAEKASRVLRRVDDCTTFYIDSESAEPILSSECPDCAGAGGFLLGMGGRAGTSTCETCKGTGKAGL